MSSTRTLAAIAAAMTALRDTAQEQVVTLNFHEANDLVIELAQALAEREAAGTGADLAALTARVAALEAELVAAGITPPPAPAPAPPPTTDSTAAPAPAPAV